MGEMAKVLVLKRRPDGGHVGFWTEFEGEKVSSYEDTRGDNNIVYTWKGNSRKSALKVREGAGAHAVP
jgi:hypothetical protein